MTNSFALPDELVERWRTDYMGRGHAFLDVAKEIAQWGADQELEACCVEMKSLPGPLGIPFGEMASNALRASRRPKPPTLKDQALALINRRIGDGYVQMLTGADAETIRTALEALDD
jgi:hypothetical protein